MADRLEEVRTFGLAYQAALMTHEAVIADLRARLRSEVVRYSRVKRLIEGAAKPPRCSKSPANQPKEAAHA